MALTIYDIAQRAGVSIATVSRVLHGGPVSEKTRARIEKVMADSSYSPSMIARGMSTKSLKSVAIAVNSLEHLHHMRIAHEIESVFSELEYNVVMYESGASAPSIFRFLSRMKELSIDGIIMIGSVFRLVEKDAEAARPFLDAIPIVIANGWIEGTYGLIVDEAKGCEDAVKYLSGKRKSLIFIEDSGTDSAERKEQGFWKAAAECSLPARVLHFQKDASESSIAEAIGKPDNAGIIADNDRLGLKSVNGLRRAGFRIPEDAAVIGYDNSAYSELSDPKLTTVDNFASLQGRMCAEYLRKALDGYLGEKRILDVLLPELVIRESS